MDEQNKKVDYIFVETFHSCRFVVAHFSFSRIDDLLNTLAHAIRQSMNGK